MEKGKNPGFLKEKYADLPGSPEVNRTIARDRALHKGDVNYREPKSKEGRIDAYLQFLEDRFSSDDLLVMAEEGDENAGDIIEIREQDPLKNEAFRKLKEDILNRYTMQIHDQQTLTHIAEGLYASEKKLVIERGMGAQIPALEGKHDAVIARYRALIQEKHAIQKQTLTSWLDYLQENDAKQPMWFRYLVVRSLEKMGSLDKERLDYSRRTVDTIAPFAELNSEALAWVYTQMLQFKEHGLELPAPYFVPDEETQKKKDQILSAIRSKDFAKLYAFAQVETAGRLDKESLVGEWKKYVKGSDSTLLQRDIKGKGTGWCTAEGSAEGQLEAGDFYVYFTNNQAGVPTEPRIAIRMEQDQVAEVRGVDKRQSLEPTLVETAQSFYKDLPGGDKYDKKAFDMKLLTALDQKVRDGKILSKDDLVFLYEMNAPIEGFGYDKDPRVTELRKQRNVNEDILIIFECSENQIAYSIDQINESTKAYVGKLEPGIFNRLPEGVEHVFTSFPEDRIRREQIEIGGKTERVLEDLLERSGFKIGEYARSMMRSKDFTTLKNPEQETLIRLRVEDLGFPNGATTQEIFARAEALGLELCPAEVGPYYRLKYVDQPMHEWVRIGMKPIIDSDGRPGVFGVARIGDGSWLDYYVWAGPDYRWDAGSQFVFRLRKFTQPKL